MNVHKMNEGQSRTDDHYRSLLLLDEIAKGAPLSQRDMSRKLNIALGLVNAYLKNLISRGFVKIQEVPAKRYSYYLTPKGFSEKTRLTYHFLQNYTNLFRTARRDFQSLFHRLRRSDWRKVVFAGADEMSEIAYLSLQEVGMELTGIVDTGGLDKTFFRKEVQSVEAIRLMEYDGVIITAYAGRGALEEDLLANGVPPEKIFSLDHWSSQ